jgi:hypothetical protein
VVRRGLGIFSDFTIGNLAHSALLLEINGQNSLVEYMDTNGGSVNNFDLGSKGSLKYSLNIPTDCFDLQDEICLAKKNRREACKND